MSAFEPSAFAFSPAHAARFSGLGLTRIKTLVRTGVLPKRKDGRRTIILRSDIEAYLKNLDVETAPATAHGKRGRFAAVRP